MEFVDDSLLQFCKRKYQLVWLVNGLGLVIEKMMVRWLTGECSLLEDLFCSNCWNLKHLCVSRAVKLKFGSPGVLQFVVCRLEVLSGVL
ncbi:hypothetical protein AB3S75_030831 [Citrus x aurantiifolia]